MGQAPTCGAAHDGQQAGEQAQQAGLGAGGIAQGHHPQLQAVLQQVELVWLHPSLSAACLAEHLTAALAAQMLATLCMEARRPVVQQLRYLPKGRGALTQAHLRLGCAVLQDWQQQRVAQHRVLAKGR